MKGFLTFTLAAGVAITTTSVAHAAGTGNAKGGLNVSKAPAVAQASMGISGLGLTFDRTSLTRELDRLNQLLATNDDDGEATDAPAQQKAVGAWNW